MSKPIIIIKNTRDAVAKIFHSGNTVRNKSVFKNIGLGFVARVLTIALTFLQIPITLRILNKTEYGIWITLFSVTTWLSCFDLGLGNGLRNKLTEALAANNIAKAKAIVSTAYTALSCLFFFFILLFSSVAYFIPWARILNTSLVPANDLLILVYCCFICSMVNFVANLIQAVFAANHLSGRGNMLQLCNQGIILLATLIVKHYMPAHALLIIGIILSVSPLFINIAASIYLYRKNFKLISPSVKFFNKFLLGDIMTIGIRFFIIQMAVLIIFSTDNFLITQIYSPSEVVYYNIVYQYFSVIPVFFAIITAPLWTMYTDAYSNNDITWINNSVKNLLRIYVLVIVIVLGMVLCYRSIFSIWLGKGFVPSFALVVLIAIYMLQIIWNNIFVTPLNSIGKLGLQMYLSIFAALINVPLAIFISKYIHNVTSIILANIGSLLSGSILISLQYKSIFVKRTMT